MSGDCHVVLAALHVQLLLVEDNLKKKKNKAICVCLLDLDLAAYIHDEPLVESELYGVHELWWCGGGGGVLY